MKPQNDFVIQFKKIAIKALVYGTISLATIIVLLILLVKVGAFGKLPNETDLKQVKNNTATEIISVDNKLLGRYYYENRTNVNLKDIPPELIHALIATEDARFYKHNGVDLRSTLRVLVKSIILFDKSAGGGSTLTQQLAKNLYPRKNFGILTIPVAKIREIIIAKRLEKVYSKDEILEMYLNTVSFGENTYGIETAAIIFFNKEPKDLKLEESALLVGMLKANGNYNPRTNPGAAMNRRNTVLNQMVKYGYLKKESADSLKKIAIKLHYRRLTHNDGPAPYFREELRHEVTELLKEKKKPDGSAYNIYADGLKIYTTINYTMQVYAEDAVKEHLSQLQKIFDRQWKGREPWVKNPSLAKQAITQSRIYKSLSAAGYSYNDALQKMKSRHETQIFGWNGDIDTVMSSLDSVLYHFKTLQTGVLVMNPFNGDVLTWIGGPNHKYFQYDHVKARRQVGSTFKPVVYAAGLKAGIDPCKFYANDSTVYADYDDWTPENSEGKYGGYYTMKGALAKSINTVSVKILMEAGIDSTVALAHRMGISSDLPMVPSLALGTGEISLYEMVKAYSVFLNRGKSIEPRLIRRIEDSQGHVIYSDPAHEPGDSVLSPEITQTILAMMQGVVDRGTAASLRTVWKFNNQLAGKTGTTQNQSDGWFIGMNPRMVIGVWVGGDNPVVRFRSTYFGQGSYAALPVFARFLTKLYRDPLYKYMQNATFNIDDSIYDKLNCDDFSEEKPENNLDTILNIFKKDEGIGDFIRRIFGRKKKKYNSDNNDE